MAGGEIGRRAMVCAGPASLPGHAPDAPGTGWPGQAPGRTMPSCDHARRARDDNQASLSRPARIRDQRRCAARHCGALEAWLTPAGGVTSRGGRLGVWCERHRPDRRGLTPPGRTGSARRRARNQVHKPVSGRPDGARRAARRASTLSADIKGRRRCDGRRRTKERSRCESDPRVAGAGWRQSRPLEL